MATLSTTHPLLLLPLTLEPLSIFNIPAIQVPPENNIEYSDTVTVAGLTVTSQTFGAATHYSSGLETSSFPADGVMGMRLDALSILGARPVFQTLVAQGQADLPVFAMKLAASGSELTLGGLNENIFTGDVTYVPVNTLLGFWQPTFDALNVGGTQVIGSTSCIIDSVRSHYYFLTPLD
jgi:cathepsin D